jgi:hypothetical protein
MRVSHARIPATRQLAMQRLLIVVGVVLVVVGLAWPWISKLGLGRLPGDIHIQRDGFDFYFPVTTGIVISLVISVVLWLLRK